MPMGKVACKVGRLVPSLMGRFSRCAGHEEMEARPGELRELTGSWQGIREYVPDIIPVYTLL